MRSRECTQLVNIGGINKTYEVVTRLIQCVEKSLEKKDVDINLKYVFYFFKVDKK